MSAAARSTGSAAVPHRSRSWLGVHLDPIHASGRLPASIVALVSALLLWAFLYSSLFQVDTVTVSGAEYSNVEELVGLAQVQDQSVFRASPDAIVERIEGVESVQNARVEVRVPGSVAITIIEPEPVVVIESAGNQSLVSAEGVVISDSGLEGLPRLQVEGAESSSPIEASPELVAAVRAIFGLYGDTVDMIWTIDIGLTIELSDGRVVLIGQPEEIEAKLTVLPAIESQVGSNWSQLDLRVPSRPAYR